MIFIMIFDHDLGVNVSKITKISLPSCSTHLLYHNFKHKQLKDPSNYRLE